MNVLIIPELLDKSKDLEKQLMDEMSEMDRAINDAALRIEVCPHPLCLKTLFECLFAINDSKYWN